MQLFDLENQHFHLKLFAQKNTIIAKSFFDTSFLSNILNLKIPLRRRTRSYTASRWNFTIIVYL